MGRDWYGFHCLTTFKSHSALKFLACACLSTHMYSFIQFPWLGYVPWLCDSSTSAPLAILPFTHLSNAGLTCSYTNAFAVETK